MTYVHLAQGRRYHAGPECDALVQGQILRGTLNAWSPGAWLTMSELAARERGATPCGVCLPGHPLPPIPGLFGHQPYEYDGALICQRCYLGDDSHRDVVYWPCTTALLLGLDKETGQ